LVKEAELTAKQREELLYKQQQHTLHHYFKAQQSRHTNTGSKHKPSIFSPVFFFHALLSKDQRPKEQIYDKLMNAQVDRQNSNETESTVSTIH